DEAVVSMLADGEEMPLAVVPLLADVLEPFLGLLEAHRHAVSRQAADLGVVDAGDVRLHVPLLEWPKPDALALQQRSLGDRGRCLIRHGGPPVLRRAPRARR